MAELITAWMLGFVTGWLTGIIVAGRPRPTCRQLMRDPESNRDRLAATKRRISELEEQSND